MPVLRWLRAHDAGLWATRRAARTAIVMPILFALGTAVLGNATLATFAAFGSFALLLLVDFDGTRRERAEGLASVAIVGAVLVALGTAVSTVPWLAALTMAVVAFLVLFLGVISSVLASASTALLLSFVLPVATVGSVATIPDRLAGWALASVVALVAATTLWPAPARNPLRAPAIACCRLVAARLRTEYAWATGALDDASERDGAVQQAIAASTDLRAAFYATPNRPTGLSTASRTLVRLVDELGWLSTILDAGPPSHRSAVPDPAAGAVKLAAADVLAQAADLLERTRTRRSARDLSALQEARARLHERLIALEVAATVELPVRTGCVGGVGVELVDALEPTFRSQEMAFAVTTIGANVAAATAAEDRGWLARSVGRRPDGGGTLLGAARERAAAHLEVHSVWLHNSLRGAVGLALAVLVADLSGVQHSFWVVLGTLSVLRSSALSTGQNILRTLLGTTAGIVVGGVVVIIIGTNTTVLWVLLPICILLAGLAPAAISFTAGQAGFTVTLVILFNIIQPVGYRIGFNRIEDIAIGCAISLVVGLLFWPRGAASVLGRALAEAYAASVAHLRAAVDFGIQRCDLGGPTAPRPDGAAAAAASRRLDDAFREYLAERGAKQLAVPEVTTLVTGVIAPRLAGDAVLELWAGECGAPGGDRTAAGGELRGSADLLAGWYATFGSALAGRTPVPPPLDRDRDLDQRLVAAVRRDLADHTGLGTPTAVRMIWTGEHLDAVRRLQPLLVEPARTLTTGEGPRPPRTVDG